MSGRRGPAWVAGLEGATLTCNSVPLQTVLGPVAPRRAEGRPVRDAPTRGSVLREPAPLRIQVRSVACAPGSKSVNFRSGPEGAGLR